MVKVSKPGRRSGTKNEQFNRRMKSHLIEAAKGVDHKFVFPAKNGLKALPVTMKVNPKGVVAFTYGTNNAEVLEQRLHIAHVEWHNFLDRLSTGLISLSQVAVDQYAQEVYALTRVEGYDNTGLPSMQKTNACLLNMFDDRRWKLDKIFVQWPSQLGPFNISTELLPNTFAPSDLSPDAMEYRVGFLVNWWLCENDKVVNTEDRYRLVQATDFFARRVYSGTNITDRVDGGRQKTKESAALILSKKYTLTDIFELWKSLKTERKPNSVKAWKTVLNRLIKFLGHENLNDISAEDLERWKLSFGSKYGTFNNTHLVAAKRLFSLALTKEMILANPTTQLLPIDGDGEDDGRRPYYDREVIHILSQVKTNTDPATKWIPLLVALTGSRVREISQLHSSQVGLEQEHKEFWTITITDKLPFQEMEILNRRHTVPLHPDHFKKEFFEFVESRSGKYLFADPDLEKEYTTSPFQSAMDRSRRWIQSVFKEDDAPSPHHGFRKWFKTKAFSKTEDHDCVEYIQGHQREYAKRKYRPHPFQKDCMKVINAVFSDMDFTPTKPALD